MNTNGTIFKSKYMCLLVVEQTVTYYHLHSAIFPITPVSIASESFINKTKFILCILYIYNNNKKPLKYISLFLRCKSVSVCVCQSCYISLSYTHTHARTHERTHTHTHTMRMYACMHACTYSHIYTNSL